MQYVPDRYKRLVPQAKVSMLCVTFLHFVHMCETVGDR